MSCFHATCSRKVLKKNKMFNALKSMFNAEGDDAGGNPGEGGDAGGNPSADQGGDNGTGSVYDKDEIRKKRLAKVEAVGGSNVSAPTGSVDGSKDVAPVLRASNSAGSNEVKPAVPVLRASNSAGSNNEAETKLPPAPQINDKSPPLMPPMPPSVTLSEQNLANFSPTTTLGNSPLSNESPVALSPTTKLSRSVVVLNTLFENILQITLKQANAIEPIKYMGGNGSDSDMITADDITGLLCNRLLESQEVNGGIGYLVGCYKRLIQKQKDYDNTSNKTDKVIAENLSRCKEELVRFIGSGTNPL